MIFLFYTLLIVLHLGIGLMSGAINAVASEHQCLAKNIYYEASVESDRGKLAVAQVTLNRASLEQQSICKTVYEKNQFSWTRKRHKKAPTGQAWIDSQKVAIAALSGKHIPRLKKSTLYHTTKVKPRWDKKKHKFICRIGSHKFYTET